MKKGGAYHGGELTGWHGYSLKPVTIIFNNCFWWRFFIYVFLYFLNEDFSRRLAN